MLAVVVILVVILHELTHYITYKLFTGPDINGLNFSKDKKIDIPYFKIKNSIDKKGLILGLVLPCITTSLIVIVFNIITGNLAYTLVLALSLAISGADFEMAIQLTKSKAQRWKSLDGEFGFIGEINKLGIH